jgi:hypothetical protein
MFWGKEAAMRIVASLVVVGLLLGAGRAFAFGIDVGPVHIHGTKVKVGEETTLRIVADELKYDDKDGKKVLKSVKGHRKGDSEDTFSIKVDMGELGDSSKEVLAKIKEAKRYRMTIRKQDEGWLLMKIKEDDEE